MNEKKRFAVTMGDPCGIGAEIIIRALMERPEFLDRCIVYGSAELLSYAAARLGWQGEIRQIASGQEPRPGSLAVVDPLPVALADIPVGEVSATGGACAFAYVRAAIEDALAGRVRGVVTAPLNKEALHLAGHDYAGHTEIFTQFCGASGSAMLLWSEQLCTIHVTTHIPFAAVPGTITVEREAQVIRLADGTLRRLGREAPRIAVAALNPHAGENGLFGDEEARLIAPAIAQCRSEGIDVSGPIAPDTVFLRALKGEYDIVVAQYHDQGHIPLKLLAFDSGVNITVGIPVVRTSVDHGTAFDIASQFVASPKSLIQAMIIGERL